MFDLFTVITYARALRRACEARAKDHDDAEAEHDARLALLNLARGMDVQVYPVRPSRWIETDALARNVEAAAEGLAAVAEGDWQNAGHIARLSLHFGALASRMGHEIETPDHQARDAVEGIREAAE